MKVILNQDVINLGEEGDVKTVADGYARNYLIPKQLAVVFNKQTVALFESRRAAIEKRKEEKRQQAQSLKERIESLQISLQMPAGDNGKLFGSVTSATLVEELGKLGISIERKKIEIPDHSIKMTGNYTARVKLYGNEEASLKVAVSAIPVKEEKKEEGRAGKEGRSRRGAKEERAKPSSEEQASVETPVVQEESEEAKNE